MNENLDGLDLPAITNRLQDEGIPVTAAITAQLVGGGKSNLTYLIDTGAQKLVLRRPPLGEIPPGAHDVIRESKVQQALQDSPVPVPRIISVDPDGDVLGVPHYIMGAVDGIVIRTRADAEKLDIPIRKKLSESLVDRLADLHSINPTEVGLENLGNHIGYLERQVSRWLRQYKKIEVRDLPQVATLGTYLSDTLPQDSSAAIVHGDYRLDNVMVSANNPEKIVAVLDWEMATLGDPLADLATLVMFWDEPGSTFNPITGGLTAFPGFLSKEQVIERYLNRRELDGVDLRWYLVFSTFKLAVILEQIHARYVAGKTIGEGFRGIDQMVDQLLDESSTYL